MSWIVDIGPFFTLAASALLFVIAVFANSGAGLNLNRNCCVRDHEACRK